MFKPDNGPPHLLASAPPPPKSPQEVPLSQLWASLPPEKRRRLSQIMARVIARHRLLSKKEVPDD
jgi:hypothetical protein